MRIGLAQLKSIGPEDMLRFADPILHLSGTKMNQRQKWRIFRSHFGIDPDVASSLWARVRTSKRSSLPRGACVHHLLWSLLWMKSYETVDVMCTLCAGGRGGRRIHRETFIKWSKIFVEEISKLAPEEIRWENRLKFNNGSICKVTIDGTDFRICCPKGKWKKYYSHKFNGPALRYEVAISITAGDIVSINGPYPCGIWPDINIFRAGLKQKLELGKERVEADDGYAGEPLYVERPHEGCFHTGYGLNDPCPGCVQRRKKARLRSRQETCNKRFKKWGILAERYRHGDEVLHKKIFTAIATMTQIEIRTGRKLFYCDGTYRTMESQQSRMFNAFIQDQRAARAGEGNRR